MPRTLRSPATLTLRTAILGLAACEDLTAGTTKLILVADDSDGRQTRGEDFVTVKP